MTDRGEWHCHVVGGMKTGCAAANCLLCDARVEHDGGLACMKSLIEQKAPRASSLLLAVYAENHSLTLLQRNLMMMRHAIRWRGVHKLIMRHAIHRTAMHRCSSPVTNAWTDGNRLHLSFVGYSGHAFHLLVKLIQPVQDSQPCACRCMPVSQAKPAGAAAMLCRGGCMASHVHAGTTQSELQLLYTLPEVITLDVGIHLGN